LKLRINAPLDIALVFVGCGARLGAC
jgi:hypothetical protein